MSILPPVKEAGKHLRACLPEMAEKLGVGRNTMVNLGTQDVASALAGAGADKKGKYYVYQGRQVEMKLLY